MLRLSLFAALALGGCAAQSLPAVQAGHPASALTASAPVEVDATALAPAEQPVLPLALRRDSQLPANGMAGMDHGNMAGMDHGNMAGMDHGNMAGMEATSTSPMSPAAPAAGLTETLDAYLAIHGALAADRLPDATAQAAALAAAFETLTAQTPAGDPHFWHSRADDLATIRAQTTALGAASDVDAARAAFGVVSVAMVRLVQDLGVPAGYDLAVMTCGMAPGVPDGGVWLQRVGATANPYFGAAMPSCGSPAEPAPATDGHAGH